jgi:hypothetical protein
LKPDYAKDAIEVYTDFVSHCIEEGSLDIICRHWAVPVRKEAKAVKDSLRHLLPLLPLPSWNGLLQDSPFGPPNVLAGRVNADSLVGVPGRARYNASDGEAPKRRWDIQRNPLFSATLCCKGVKLDVITELSARMVNATIPRDCLEYLGWSKSTDHTIPSRVPEKLWRTLVADRGPHGQNPPSWYHRARLHCLATTSPSGDINTGELIGDEKSSQLMVEFLKRVQSVLWSRRVLVADSKKDKLEHLFGLGREKTAVGDVIAILYGCSVPVILREHSVSNEESYFTLIGESYIHGKMDGEALSALTQE